MSPMTRLALLAALLSANLLIGSLAAPYGPAWWASAVGFVTAVVALAGSPRVAPVEEGRDES